jgi:hypothetical protein
LEETVAVPSRLPRGTLYPQKLPLISPTQATELFPMQTIAHIVGFEAFTAVNVKNAVVWDVAPCGFNRRFGGNRLLHLQSRRNNVSEEKC